jgi:hypothetical protein
MKQIYTMVATACNQQFAGRSELVHGFPTLTLDEFGFIRTTCFLEIDDMREFMKMQLDVGFDGIK